VAAEAPRLVASVVSNRLRQGETLDSLADSAYMSIDDFRAQWTGGSQ
jgi:hypothetical protein